MENRPMPPAGNHGYSPRPGGGRPRQRLARFKSRCHDGSKTEGDCRGRLDRARAAVALSDTLQYSYLYEKFRFEPREPRMSRTLILLGLTLDSSWSFVALDRMAWAWSSARRHRRRAQELHFICTDRDRAPDQRGADVVVLAHQLVRASPILLGGSEPPYFELLAGIAEHG